MGLRINSNITALRAFFNLNGTDRSLSSSIQRLSTGLRINSAADDPSGLVISDKLDAQNVALNRALENTQNGINLLNVADSALSKIGDELKTIKDSVTFALNTGGTDASQISAQQDAVDNAIQAIDRVANTTRFSDRNLLNGTSGFVTSNVNTNINDLQVRKLTLPPGSAGRTITFSLTQAASRAGIALENMAGTGTVRIVGAKGTADVNLSVNTGSANIKTAINQLADVTGVFASQISITSLPFLSMKAHAGASQKLIVSVLDAAGNKGGFVIGGKLLSTGQTASFQAVNASGTFRVRVGDALGAVSVRVRIQSKGALVASKVFSFNNLNRNVTFSKIGTDATLAAKGMGDVLATSKQLFAFSEKFGSAQTIQIQTVSGRLVGNGGTVASAAQNFLKNGQDAKINIQGSTVTGSGLFFKPTTSVFQGEFSVAPGTNTATVATGSSLSGIGFSVRQSGLTLQLSDHAGGSDSFTFGIPNVGASNLGETAIQDVISRVLAGNTTNTKGGFLDSLQSGNGNSLTTNARNASTIVDAAINQLDKLRGFLGAVQQNNLQVNQNTLEVQIQNLSASESSIKDLNFAQETTNFTKNQIKFQAGVAVLASANLVPQSVLTLLR